MTLRATLGPEYPGVLPDLEIVAPELPPDTAAAVLAALREEGNSLLDMGMLYVTYLAPAWRGGWCAGAVTRHRLQVLARGVPQDRHGRIRHSSRAQRRGTCRTG